MYRFISLALFLICGQCFRVDDRIFFEKREEGTDKRNGCDLRRPLILTPYVECGKIHKGQEAAKVDGILENVESYSGYFTVNKTHGRNLFFWYFPAEKRPADSPVLLWLQGGPGASSMLGLLLENGPIQMHRDGSVSLRPHRWTENHHVIYIDSPAGTGFSFPVPTGPIGEEEISADLYSALEQFFQLFPHLASNDFYVTGESYAGNYVPSLGYAIHKNNPHGKVKINMKGLMIGNGMIDSNCFSFSTELYREQNGIKNLPVNRFNYLRGEHWVVPGRIAMGTFFHEMHVLEKLHVGEVNFFDTSYEVFRAVFPGGGYSVTPVLEELLEHYRILYYYGQLDTACPYPPSEKELYELQWAGRSEFFLAERKHWTVNDDLAGYVKSGGNLSLALVRNAGHLVPLDQPVWGLDIIQKFINNELPL